MSFLPITRKEMKQLNISQPDFVYVIGDAYVDHPSFGPAIISRVLQAHGYTVCINCIIRQKACQCKMLLFFGIKYCNFYRICQNEAINFLRSFFDLFIMR